MTIESKLKNRLRFHCSFDNRNWRVNKVKLLFALILENEKERKYLNISPRVIKISARSDVLSIFSSRSPSVSTRWQAWKKGEKKKWCVLLERTKIPERSGVSSRESFNCTLKIRFHAHRASAKRDFIRIKRTLGKKKRVSRSLLKSI